jgi:hypothetical protein
MSLNYFIPYHFNKEEWYFKKLFLFKSLLLLIQRKNIPCQQVVCDGVFSFCERDKKTGWRRNITSCLNCESEQYIFSKNINHNRIPLSSSISSTLELQIEKLICALDKDELHHLASNTSTSKASKEILSESNTDEISKIAFFYSLSLGSFSSIFDNVEPDFSNSSHIIALKHILGTAVKMYFAAKNLFSASSEPFLLLLESQDVLTQAIQQAAEACSKEVLLVTQNDDNLSSEDRSCSLLHTRKATRYNIDPEVFHANFQEIQSNFLEKLAALSLFNFSNNYKDILNTCLDFFSISTEIYEVQNI